MAVGNPARRDAAIADLHTVTRGTPLTTALELGSGSVRGIDIVEYLPGHSGAFPDRLFCRSSGSLRVREPSNGLPPEPMM